MEQLRKTPLRLQEIMQQKGINAAKLAEACDMHPANLSGIINDKRSPNLQTLDRLAQALDVPTWTLLQNPIIVNNLEAELERQREQNRQQQATIDALRAQLTAPKDTDPKDTHTDTTTPATATQTPPNAPDYDLLTIDPMTGEAVRYRRL